VRAVLGRPLITGSSSVPKLGQERSGDDMCDEAELVLLRVDEVLLRLDEDLLDELDELDFRSPEVRDGREVEERDLSL
jgi:hypothetical protein